MALACRRCCCPRRARRPRKFIASLPTLGADFVQTFIRGVLVGYVIGCGAGLLVAVLAHRFAFLGRGLLPLGNFFSALPLVGLAPIMVMWFGFDWPSKAAVVALVTFFPMLVNTLAGLSASGHIERDLMRSYAASYPQTLTKLYLPAALPFIFNALKVNATLSLIGAIVAEFFGTPTRNRLSHLHRGRPHGHRHGLGGNRARSACRNGVLWICHAGRTRDNVLAPVVSDRPTIIESMA